MYIIIITYLIFNVTNFYFKRSFFNNLLLHYGISPNDTSIS